MYRLRNCLSTASVAIASAAAASDAQDLMRKRMILPLLLPMHETA
jgi:hypothetical protein